MQGLLSHLVCIGDNAREIARDLHLKKEIGRKKFREIYTVIQTDIKRRKKMRGAGAGAHI